MLQATGLTPGFLSRPDARISLAQQIQFYGNIGKLDDATRLSLVHGSRVRIEHHGVLDYAARSAKNLRSALQTFNGFFNVIDGVARLTLIEDRDIACWAVASLIPSGPARRVAIGEMLAGNLALMQQVTGQKLTLKEVVLDEASDHDLQAYAAHFGCPVSCDHENIELRFDSALLNNDLAFADPQAEEECIEYCRQSIARIDAPTLARWQAEAATRTLYVFDVRTPEEYQAGHIAGMKNVPGGQLVQETDRHAMTWGARVMLVDDDGVRAVMTAHWMKQMGWDAAAMTVNMGAQGHQTGAWTPRVPGLDALTIPIIDAASLRERMRAGGVSVIDLDWSRDYRDGHIPGAWYGIRSRLSEILPQLPSTDTVVFTSGDGVLAQLATADLMGKASPQALALAGGTAAWRAAGFPLEQGATRMATSPDDIRLKAREQTANVESAMQAYLSWEIDLADQMAADKDQRFRIHAG